MKILNVTTRQNVAGAALPSCPPCSRMPAAAPARGGGSLCPESTGGSLGALELLIISGSGAVETHSAAAFVAFVAQQRV